MILLKTKIFQDFCQSTSLHGYSYLYNDNSKILRIMWIIVIIMSTGLGVCFIVSNTEDYLNSKIVTTIESTTIPVEVSIIKSIT